MVALRQTVPRVARLYDAEQRVAREAAVAAVLREWSRMSGDPDISFMRIAPTLIEILNVAQMDVADRAQAYVPNVLAATGQSAADVPSFEIESRQFVGTAGDGRPTESLMYGTLTTTKEQIARGASLEAGLARGGEFLSMAVGTLLSDTSRGVEGAAGFARPVGGWTRMLTPPSCGRCIILAGKWYRKNRGFQRHPGCDCIHIPSSENVGGDMLTNTDAYLDSLDDKALAKALGSQAQAEAYRKYGADSFQLVNAYRKSGGIRTAQIYGRNVRYTLEGTTRRGVAYHQMSRVAQLRVIGESKRGGRYSAMVAPRLMPESIFAIANGNTERATKLLRDYGWLGLTP